MGMQTCVHQPAWLFGVVNLLFVKTGRGAPAAKQPSAYTVAVSSSLTVLTRLSVLPPSKQRHNKLWKQQAESNLPQNTDGSTGSGDFLLESLDVDLENRLADLDTPSQSVYLDNRAGPEVPVGYNYCFRRLSDTLLENKVPGDRESFFHVEELERDALTERATSLVRQPLPVLSEGRPEVAKGLEAAEALSELSGFQEAKKKLDFSPRKARLVLGPGEPGEDGIREENPMEKWKRRLSMHKEENRLNRENLNNNNSKRSCPEDFEVRMELKPR